MRTYSFSSNEKNKYLKYFLKFQESLINYIFWLFDALISSSEHSIFTNSYFFIFLKIIQTLQIISLAFSRDLIDIWDDSKITNILVEFFKPIKIFPYIFNFSWEVYLIVFYLAVAIVFIFFCGIIYLGVIHNKTSKILGFYISVLSVYFKLINDLLFFPMCELFISMFNCRKVNGISKHFIYDKVCWTSEQLFHSIVAIFILIIFILKQIVSHYFYYDSREFSHDCSSRMAGSSFAYFFIYPAIALIFTSIFEKEHRIILIYFLVISSIFLQIRMNLRNSPFYFESTMYFYSLITNIICWTFIFLLFAFYLEGRYFYGTLIFYFLSLVLIFFIVLTKKNIITHILLLPSHKINYAWELSRQLRYLRFITDTYDSNHISKITYDGFAMFHSQVCLVPTCPMKNELYIDQPLSKKIRKTLPNMLEREVKIAYYCNNMYIAGVRFFPKDILMRINWVDFLSNLNLYEEATEQINNAEHLSFSINYKKYIENCIKENMKNNESELGMLTNNKTLKKIINKFISEINSSSQLYMEFWAEISEINPDITKIFEFGQKINEINLKLEDTWRKIIDLKLNIPKLYKLFGKFQAQVANDIEYGENLIKKSLSVTEIHGLNFLKGKNENNENENNDNLAIINSLISEDSRGMLITVLDSNKIQVIENLNSMLLS